MSKLLFYIGATLLISAFCLVGLGSSQGQRYLANAVHEDYPGMCFYNDTQTPIEIGTTFRPIPTSVTECVEIKCREDFTLLLLFCPFYQIGPGCTVSVNKSVEFPECCAKITCPNRIQ